MDQMIKSVALPNGVELRYVEQGAPERVPVVLLHGYSDSWRSFEGVLPHLPDSLHVYVPTQRGHGDSDRPEAGYLPGDFAADLVSFMDALGIGQAVVAGHSMGSAVAQCFAIDHPERLLGLVLVGASATMKGNAGLAELREPVAGLSDPVPPDFVLDFQRSTLARPVPQAFIDMVVEESLKVPARVWKAVLAGLLETDMAADLGRIRAPTLIVWGDRDALFSRSDQEALTAGIPTARLVVYPGAGHAPHWEEPARFAADLAAFVSEVVDVEHEPGRLSN